MQLCPGDSRRAAALAILIALLVLLPRAARAQTSQPAALPTEWIDPDTGHRIIRLSKEDGSQSLYFHQNAYTPDGKKLLIMSPTGIYTIDLASRQIDPVVHGKVNLIVAGHKTGRIYFTRRKDGSPLTTVFTYDLATHQETEIATLPQGGSVTTVNADETLLGGSVTYPPPSEPGATQPATMPRDRFSTTGRIDIGYHRGLHLPMDLFTINIGTKELKLFNHSTEWLNHIQFSPSDPNLMMFCHEGPWQLVDRIWTINVTGGEPKLVHERTMVNEIAGHEFFSGDGKTIWYDLQTPISTLFWVAGYNLDTGIRTWYHVERSEWSVHYNVSPDGTLFAGDGGGPASVAAPGNGQWIYLFRPQLATRRGAPPAGRGAGGQGNTAGRSPATQPGAAPIVNPNGTRPPGRGAQDPEKDQSHLVMAGVLHAERLVNLAKHDYNLEPNVTFTPDMKWIVFRSNMLGPIHVYAVEIAKAQQ